MLISLSLIFFVASLIGRLIQEKSSRMKVNLHLYLSLLFHVFYLLVSWHYRLSRCLMPFLSGSDRQELLKLTGMTSWMHWGSWFINGFIFLLVVFVIMIGLLSINVPSYVSLFNTTNKFILFIFLVFYAISTIFLCFTVSVFFPRGIVKFNTLFCVIRILDFLKLFQPLVLFQESMGEVHRVQRCLYPLVLKKNDNREEMAILRFILWIME